MSPGGAALSARVLIIGNSGSGKSTLAGRIAARTAQPVFEMDLIHWHDDGGKRDEAVARDMIRSAAAGPRWIIEGVYGWLAEVACPRATALIWTDLPWALCRDGLLRRGLRRGMTDRDQDALLVWAEAYGTRSTPSSSVGHGRLFAAFAGPKVRLTTRRDVEEVAAGRDIRLEPTRDPSASRGDAGPRRP